VAWDELLMLHHQDVFQMLYGKQRYIVVAPSINDNPPQVDVSNQPASYKRIIDISMAEPHFIQLL
jgi:hypothetical protein